MGKPKRHQKPKKVSALGSDDEDLYRDFDDADPKAREYIYNEIDNFNDDRERIPLESEDEDHLPFKSLNEEVLPLPDDSDDDSEEDDAIYNNDFYSRMTQKDEIASDIEDNEDDNLPNEKAWGKRKNVYYNTDYVDKDYDGFQGSDTELAEAEEKEATRIQKRLLQELSEEDFGLDWIAPMDKSNNQHVDLNKEKISSDLSTLTESKKLEVLGKESPELLYLVKDFELRMTELKDKILPLIPLVEDGRIPPGMGADYLTVKRKLIYLYCMNITFYLMIRCKDVNVRHHPVMKRLSTFRKLLDQLEPMSKMLDGEIEAVLEMLADGKPITPLNQTMLQATTENGILRAKLKKREKKKKTVSFVEDQETDSKELSSEKRRKRLEETADEKEALQMYELMKKKQRMAQASSDDDSGDDDDVEMPDDARAMMNEEGDEAANEKREISYQIAKNKGLTPHRKKEYRNPRVRHRVKFQKAKVRRKGQYKAPRKELQRYGGEISGIRIGSKRGIKLK